MGKVVTVTCTYDMGGSLGTDRGEKMPNTVPVDGSDSSRSMGVRKPKIVTNLLLSLLTLANIGSDFNAYMPSHNVTTYFSALHITKGVTRH